MSETDNSQKMSRRDFLKAAGIILGRAALPDWFEAIEEDSLFSVKELLELLEESDELFEGTEFEGWREDLLECEDFDEALNFAFSILIDVGIEAEEFFIEKGLFIPSEDDDSEDDDV